MKRQLARALQSVLQSVKPTLLRESLLTQRPVEFPVFSPGPSPIRWHELFSRRTSRLVSRFEELCRRGTPLKREIEEVLWKLKRARVTVMEEVNETRMEFARRSVALLNGINLSPSGSQILYFGIPTLLSLCNLNSSLAQSHQRPFISNHQQRRMQWWDRLRQELMLFCRCVSLWLLFLPVLLTAPVALGLGIGRGIWMECFRWTLAHSGPAFIKWGQWGASRPDLLPVDLCHALEQLQSQAPVHTFQMTKKEIETAFGMALEELFEEFDHEPVASGSIAQVHKAKLTERMATCTGLQPGTWVAVKVRHPHVQTRMAQDFALMVRACRLASKIPFFSGLRLEESMRQFGGPLHEQLDFRLEAENLDRFRRNFHQWPAVGFPAPLYPLVTESVLVERFEDGDLISYLVHHPDYHTSAQISQTGLELYIKMLIQDNFVHADLHPGNILVQTQSHSQRNSAKLVLLDAGMVTELTAQDRQQIVAFFKALTQIDGASVARTILKMAVDNSTCTRPDAFVQDMKAIFDDLDFDVIKEKTSEIIQDMLTQVRRHNVTLKGSVCTLMATTLVLEGWSTKLNPDISIMEHLKATLPKPLEERVAESIESQIVTCF